MRIVFNEVKKLLNWKILSLVVLISLIFYQLFLDFEFSYFPNGRPALDEFRVSQQMIETYGPEVDEEEFLDFRQQFEREIEKAEDTLQSRQEFIDSGITTYEQFQGSSQPDQQLEQLRDEVFFTEENAIFWELQARESIISFYETRMDDLSNDDMDFGVSHTNWKESILDSHSKDAILPYFVFENYTNLVTMLSILIIVIVMIVAGRIFIVDQKNDLILLQYTSKMGRNIFKAKIAAAFIVTLVITTVYISLFLTLYKQNDTELFLNSSIQSFYNLGIPSWLDITFGQYILFTLCAVYILAIVSALISAYISRIVLNFISLIGSQIPYVIIVTLLLFEYLISNFLTIKYPIYLSIVTYIGLIVVGIGLLYFRWKKEQKVDIV
ncbi:hypothetical protein FZW96_12960 [Bacillus sp. BGMRC 2118]|nr:hypothetical protein FZW96_12960 [Bacillus sp. BGMRC 2118]